MIQNVADATRWAWIFLAALHLWCCGESPRPHRAPAGHLNDAIRVMDYDLSVRITPSDGRLEGEALIRGDGGATGALHLFLNRNFAVQSVEVDGKAASFAWDDAGGTLPYVPVARALRITPEQSAGPARNIHVRYTGHIDATISDINMVTPQLVELAAYAAYYPMPSTMGSFPFTLRVTLPSSFTIVTRGERVQSSVTGDLRTEVWRASIPGVDIPVVASAQLRTESMRAGAIDVSVFFRDLQPESARQVLREAVATLDYLTSEFGAPTASALQVVFSPRGGWGYSRTGIIVVSEQRHLQRASEEGIAGPEDMNLHGNAHEIGHFWWHVASNEASDDWINEALAEYSAAMDSRRRGSGTYRSLAETYLESLRSSPPPVGILATSTGASYRHANWYERGALFFICSEVQYGKPVLHKALIDLLALGRAQPVTTKNFVEILDHDGIDRAWIHGWLEEATLSRAEACVANLPR